MMIWRYTEFEARIPLSKAKLSHQYLSFSIIWYLYSFAYLCSYAYQSRNKNLLISVRKSRKELKDYDYLLISVMGWDKSYPLRPVQVIIF